MATRPDTEADCPVYDQLSGHVDTNLRGLGDFLYFGQFVAAAGANGCLQSQ
jgi:hypothetical protein